MRKEEFLENQDSASLRNGSGDAFLVVNAPAASGTWNVNAAGAWSTAGNWTPAGVPGTAAGGTVGLTFHITAARTVTINTTSRTVGTLRIGDSGSSYFGYTLTNSGGATLPFNNSGRKLNISGGCNGDLYVCLTHSSGFSVLLNRVGRMFAADMSGGDQSMLVSWELEITAVSQPVPVAFGIFGGLVMIGKIVVWRRRKLGGGLHSKATRVAIQSFAQPFSSRLTLHGCRALYFFSAPAVILGNFTAWAANSLHSRFRRRSSLARGHPQNYRPA